MKLSWMRIPVDGVRLVGSSEPTKYAVLIIKFYSKTVLGRKIVFCTHYIYIVVGLNKEQPPNLNSRSDG